MNRYRYYSQVEDPENLDKIVGSSNLEKLNFNYSDNLTYTITQETKYNPYRIAEMFYGNKKYFWILIVANDIKKSPNDFSVGTKLSIPNPKKIIGKI